MKPNVKNKNVFHKIAVGGGGELGLGIIPLGLWIFTFTKFCQFHIIKYYLDIPKMMGQTFLIFFIDFFNGFFPPWQLNKSLDLSMFCIAYEMPELFFFSPKETCDISHDYTSMGPFFSDWPMKMVAGCHTLRSLLQTEMSSCHCWQLFNFVCALLQAGVWGGEEELLMDQPGYCSGPQVIPWPAQL